MIRLQSRSKAGIVRALIGAAQPFAVVAVLLFAVTTPFAQQVFIDGLWVNDPALCAVPAGTSRLTCTGNGINRPLLPSAGNLSNNPHIEFAQTVDPACPVTPLPSGTINNNFCNNRLVLCAKVGWANTQSGNSAFALDFVSFEIFKFAPGSNPLAPESTPPLRTFFVDNPGFIAAGTDSANDCPGAGTACVPMCILWDGSINIQGEFGKSNGQFGFRATVATNQTGASGNINITQTRAYPGGFTKDENNAVVDEKPIIVDVTDVHVVRTSPTVVGALTGVAAEPYNITYRLAKDATMFLSVVQGDGAFIRHVVNGLPRVGEGIPSGTLQNGDSWNGRFENGDLGPPGVYLATLQSFSLDEFGADLSVATTRQIALDTLQITDIRVQPLTEQSTSLAVLSYLLTEPATVFIDIYPPGTAFTNGLNNVNDPTIIPDLPPAANQGVHKNFGPTQPLVRHLEEQQDFRKPVISFWDGRDSNGKIMDDGNYVFVLYASLPSQNGVPFNGVASDRRVWSTNARSGFLSINRGLVTISQVGPASTVIGSSPPVAGLDPFTFSYSLSREAFVSLKIFNSTGENLIKTLINNQVRPGNFLNRERWLIPTDDTGGFVSSGTYLIQLTASDPFFPAKISTTTALFPVDLFRITDVSGSPLLTGATDVVTISYQLSQPMNIVWNIYPPGTTIQGSSSTWPPCGVLDPGGACGQIVNSGNSVAPLISIKGMRPGRLRITEFWDGRDSNGLFIPDGTYIYTLVAESTTTPRFFATDQVTGALTVARGSIVFPVFSITPTFPTLFNSSQTISLPPYEVDYSLTRQSSVTISILTTNSSPVTVRTLILGQVRDSGILNREFWDARDDGGNFVEPGFYTVRAVADDLASVLSSGSTAQQTISVDPLRIYDVAVSPLRADFGTALIAYQVSETMRVAVKIFRPGTTFDNNGNPTPPESQSLIKRIIGVRPARTETTEVWDGTDETLAIVPDGNYIFKIVGSTDIAAINAITGDIAPGAALAEDLIIAEIPVVRGGSQNPQADFVNNTFVFPNPIRGANATFRIYSPLQATVSLKIFNLAGDLILTKEFGTQAEDSFINFLWDKTNQQGRPVAHGVYFFVVRQETNRGSKGLFQVVKKLLIP
ncbi:MAG: hypothetical protein COB53_00760 [Elusimicrobia bacterium]|nr:MAG: hypothetical protein COB53_00760 [Elusimicrobiota bacterium]